MKSATGGVACCPPAMCLFLLKKVSQKKTNFVPIAIQLKPNDRDYLFVSDTSNGWLLAKMYYRCAVANVHEVSLLHLSIFDKH